MHVVCLLCFGGEFEWGNGSRRKGIYIKLSVPFVHKSTSNHASISL